jgi:hypothetical protein
VFEHYGPDRLTQWKNFRDSLETDPAPFESVLKYWLKAPLVNRYLNQNDASSWPDPWHLVLDSKYDELAIVLGMLYTLRLTVRFSQEQYKIYMIEKPKDQIDYCLLVSDRDVLNLEYGQISNFASLEAWPTNIIYSV